MTGMKVLVVEDSAGHAALVRELLETAAPGGFDVVVAPDLAAAIAQLLDDGADVVLLDLGLPDADGMTALEQVRTAALDAPVVVLSGRDDDALAQACVEAGAQDYLVKGTVDGRTLARALRHGVERARRERALAHQALLDPLTALPNRTLFADRLRQALNRLGRTQTCLAVMFLDLDGFKTVNDTRGHAAGDALLRDVADTLREVVRGGDTAARIGGDEFVVLAEDVAGVDDARAIAERLLAELPVGASLGVALAGDGGESPDALVKDADAAMYAVKRRGGGAVEIVGADRLDPAHIACG
jgi:diguanylate cyclase (GGDEF)-like protein